MMSLEHIFPQQIFIKPVEDSVVFIAPNDMSSSKLNDSEKVVWPMEFVTEIMPADLRQEDNVFTASDLPSFEGTDSCTDDTDSLRNFEWCEEEENVSLPNR
jgi:hypothetical protein